MLKTGQERSALSKQEAIALYRQAGQLFNQNGDIAEASLVESLIGNCLLRLNDLEGAGQTLQHLSGACEQRQYKWLLAFCYGDVADWHNIRNEFSTGLEYRRRALTLQQQIEARAEEMEDTFNLATSYRRLGENRLSLSLLERSLSIFESASPEPTLTRRLYQELAFIFTSLGLYRTAIDYQKEVVRLAYHVNKPLTISRSLIFLGLIYGKLREFDEATRYGQLAFETGRPLTDDLLGLDIMAYASLRLGHLYRESGDYHRALASYDFNIQAYQKLDMSADLFEAHKGKFLTSLAQNDISGAETALQTSLTLFEHYRRQIIEEGNRNSFYETGQDIYDLAIDFLYTRKHQPEKAFECSENSRGRSLLDLLHSAVQVTKGDQTPQLQISPVSQPLDLPAIQRRMPDQTRIVQYALLEDRTMVWVVTKTACTGVSVPAGRKQVTTLAQSYIQLVASPAEATSEKTRAYSQQLYDLLIKPIESWLDQNTELCIVPDKILNFVPFAALWSAPDNRYLIEKYPLTVSPSATLFVLNSETALALKKNDDEKLLIAGNPDFDKQAFPTLTELPATVREVENIAAIYPRSLKLLGPQAREGAFQRAMPHAGIIHLATHGVIDDLSPLQSKLLLSREPVSADPAGDGLLRAAEIYQMKLPGVRLVVLSACQSGVERYYNGEGMTGFARAFLVAGVPLVVSSLWQVDSEATAELMSSFHRIRRQERLPATRALQRAQMAMISDPDKQYRQPCYWASFAAFGGHTEY
ncbi:MAG: CHAT domain-containing protein [Blastocatellia bacterium]